ncbi:hypothetical protein CDL12_14323 [Handroanthus impetiginosus]|uniref:Uncharacterized protein n=1 Tax=Handroanthus impetiginosus TaxID=429701 RepID=A0A2G9H6B1_9LAMI|nr:hypothetical protein CDL12_14323 [Handroanthus impetiginosus]
MYLNNNFSPIFGSKNLNYYQAILKEIHYVVIEVTDRSNKDIAFSKFLIRKVLTLQEWGIGLSAPRYLTKYQNQPKSFTYLDYIFAWEGGLLYENSLKRHSCSKISVVHYPAGLKVGFFGLIQFTIYYDIPWILKWNYRIFCKIEKKFLIQMMEPYLFRQNYLRWWNKFDFFDKEAVYTKRGPTTQSTPQLNLKDMLAGLSQEEAMKLFAETFGVQIGNDKGKRPMSPYQDSQDPYDEESDDSLMELTQHLGKS